MIGDAIPFRKATAIIRLANFWEILPSIQSKSVDCIITDPPYEMDISPEQLAELERVCKGHILMFCDPFNEFFKPDERAYWIKTPSTKNYSKHLGNFVEHILIKRRGDVFNTGLHWSNYTGVYNDPILTKNGHPHEKPLSLLMRLISLYTLPGQVILDPFFGSGTTLEAAGLLNRNSMGYEIEEKWYELGKERISYGRQ